MIQNAPRGCATRGDEVYAGHTARARKCATSAPFIFAWIKSKYVKMPRNQIDNITVWGYYKNNIITFIRKGDKNHE